MADMRDRLPPAVNARPVSGFPAGFDPFAPPGEYTASVTAGAFGAPGRSAQTATLAFLAIAAACCTGAALLLGLYVGATKSGERGAYAAGWTFIAAAGIWWGVHAAAVGVGGVGARWWLDLAPWSRWVCLAIGLLLLGPLILVAAAYTVGMLLPFALLAAAAWLLRAVFGLLRRRR
jgi:hypothetical protein